MRQRPVGRDAWWSEFEGAREPAATGRGCSLCVGAVDGVLSYLHDLGKLEKQVFEVPAKN